MGDTGVETAQDDIEIDVSCVTQGEEAATDSNETKDNKSTTTTGDGKPERKDPEPCDKPDENAFKQAQDKIAAELAGIQKQIDAMTVQIDAACATRQKFRDEAKSAQDQLTATLDIKSANRELIDATKEKFSEIAEARKEQRAKLEPIAQGLKFSSRADLEAAILKIEARLTSANLSSQLRAKHMSDIALKDQRMQTMRYEEQLKLVKKDLSDPDPLKSEREAKFQENKDLGATNKALYDKKKAAQTEANKWNKTIEEQIEKRRVVIAQKSEIQQRKSQLQRSFQKQERQYERYQNFLAFKEREAGRIKRAAEREQRVAAAMARAAEKAERAQASGIQVEGGEQTSDNWSGDGASNAKSATRTASTSSTSTPYIKRTNYDAQLGVIADLKRYLEFYKPKDAGRTADTSSQEAAAAPAIVPRREFNEKKTVTLLTKKKDIDDEWGSVIGTSKAAKAQREVPKPKKVKDTPVNHIPEALAKFKFVGVSPPLLSSQIDTVLKALEEQKRHYETLPDKEHAEALKKLESKDAEAKDAAQTADNEVEEDEVEEEEVEEGEIVDGDEGDEEESEPAAKDLSAQQTKAVAVTKEVLTSDAVEDLTTAFAAATIEQVNKVMDAIVHADEDATAAAEEGEEDGEEMTPEQAAAMAAMADELGEVVEEAQAGLGDWVPPVAEKKPEHTEVKPTEHKDEKPTEEPKKEAQPVKSEHKPQADEEDEGEEMTPEQAAAMAALADELGEVVEEAQAGLGDWVPPVAEKKPENKEKEKPAEHDTVPAYKTGTLAEHKLEELAAESKAYEAAGNEAASDDEELTPEQAAAMAAMADELGEVVEEAQAGLGDWVPPVASEKKPEAPTALAEITQEVQDAVVAAVTKAVDAASAGPTPATSTPAMEEKAEEQADLEDEGEEGDEEEAGTAPVVIKTAAPVQEIVEEVVEYEEVEIDEGDEEEGDVTVVDEVVEA